MLLTAVLKTWRALSPCSWTASQWPEQCNGEADIHYRQRPMPTIHTDNLSFMTWRDFWGKLTNAKDQLEKHTTHSRGNRGYPANGGEFFKNSTQCPQRYQKRIDLTPDHLSKFVSCCSFSPVLHPHSLSYPLANSNLILPSGLPLVFPLCGMSFLKTFVCLGLLLPSVQSFVPGFCPQSSLYIL